jgi:hypothetical protein
MNKYTYIHTYILVHIHTHRKRLEEYTAESQQCVLLGGTLSYFYSFGLSKFLKFFIMHLFFLIKEKENEGPAIVV